MCNRHGTGKQKISGSSSQLHKNHFFFLYHLFLYTLDHSIAFNVNMYCLGFMHMDAFAHTA